MTQPRLLALLALLLAACAVATAPVRAATGGPDDYGYTWTDNRDGCTTSVPSFGPGTMDVSGVTGILGPIDLGFSISYYGVEVSQVWISPTGYVTFRDQGPASGVTQDLPDFNAPNQVFAAHWTPVVESSLRIESTPERFHVQWLQLVDPALSRWLTDMIITPDGSFHLRWLSPAPLDAVTVGHENHSGTVGRTIWRDGVGENGFTGPGRARSVCIQAPTLLDCSEPENLACGGTVTTFLPFTNESQASNYNCSPIVYNGDEKVFRVDVTDLVSATVMIDSPFADLMQVDNPPCSEEACRAWADDRLDYGLLFPGTYWFVVDQQDLGASPTFRFTVDCTPAYATIACGSSQPGTTSGRTDSFSDHACAGVVLDGPEALYRLTNPSTQTLTATLDTLVPGLWVVIYDATTFESESNACLAAGRGGASVTDAPPGEYVIVVEGEAAAAGSYTLDVACGQTVDCAALPIAGCEQTVAGNTSASTNVLVTYPCESDAMVAPEVVYRIQNPAEQTVSARFLSSQPGMKMLLLTGCSSGSCLVADELAISCPLLPPGEYFLAVDGPAGAEGAFEIELSCSRISVGTDLQVLDLELSRLVSSCADLDAVGEVDVLLGNLGTAAAVAPFELVIFEDALPLNGRYDPAGDLLLGSLLIGTDLEGGAVATVTVPTAGTLSYRDAIIHAEIDAGRSVAEVDETNNARDSGQDCEWRPPIGIFTPVVEWVWDSPTILPSWVQVDTAPMVADVDGNGIPDVIVISGQNPAGFDEGVVRVLSGLDGSELWTADQPEARVWMTSNAAVADLDNDGRMEIVAHSYVLTDGRPGHRLVCLDDDGTVLWRSEEFIDHPDVFRGGGGASIADLNCDGSPEIVYGANAFTANGGYFWVPETGGTIGVNEDGRNLDGALSVVVDVDGDGELEVVAGPTAYKLDPTDIDPLYGVPRGAILWQNRTLLDGFPAVGQFDGDPAPEIVITALGEVMLLEGDTGDLIWRRFLPAGGGGCDLIDIIGGPPTVADFDGDCSPEVGVAGADWYVVIETDGTIKWRAPINDCSSNRTASSVFDFDGDGAAEVAFQDETSLHIYRGIDGTELTRLPAASHTWQEMITIADVDADDNAEIIMPLNSTRPSDPRGIQVVGDVDSAWVNTRRTWNQHAYHINNVNDDGSVPGPTDGCEEPSWLVHNTYRDQLGDAIFTAPDLTLTLLDVQVLNDGCVRTAEITARIGNGGGRPTPGEVMVWYYDGAPGAGGAAIASKIIPPLAPGQWLDVVSAVPMQRIGDIDIHVRVDDDGAGASLINECREDNNDCMTTVNNPGFPTEPPLPVGWALRATAHSDPYGAMITADFNWLLDEGLPRPAGDHYHVFRSTDPAGLTFLDFLEPQAALTYTDTTMRARDFELPLVHFYKVRAADLCEQLEPLDPTP